MTGRRRLQASSPAFRDNRVPAGGACSGTAEVSVAVSRRTLLAGLAVTAAPAAGETLDRAAFDARFSAAAAPGGPEVVLRVDGLREGADLTESIATALAAHPDGIDLVLPAGSWTVRIQSIILRSRTRIRGARPGATVLRAVRGRRADPAAYGDCVFSLPANTEHVRIEEIRLHGPDRYVAVAIACQTRHLTMTGIDSGNMCLLWTSRTAHAKGFLTNDAYDAFTVCRDVVVRGCRGTGSRSRPDDDGRSQWIDAAYVHHLVVEDCMASNYAHGIQIWGGNAATSAGADWNSGERRAKVASIRSSIMTDMMLGGIWASMAERVSVTDCHVARCGDVGIDFEGCADCEATGGSVADCRQALISVFFGARRIAFRGISLTFTDAVRWSDGASARFFGSWNASNQASRQQQVVLDGLLCRSETLDPQGRYPMITTQNGAVFDFAVTGSSLHNGRIMLSAHNGEYYFVAGNRLTAALAPQAAQDLLFVGRTGGAPTLERRNAVVVRDNFVEARVPFPKASAGIHVLQDADGRRVEAIVSGNVIRYAEDALQAPIAITNAMKNPASEFVAFLTDNTIPPGTTLRIEEANAARPVSLQVRGLQVSGRGRVRDGEGILVVGDSSVTLDAFSPATILFDDADLTAPRRVALPTDGLRAEGLRFRIVRSATAGGPAEVSVVEGDTVVAVLPQPSRWVDLAFTGRAWRVIGGGPL